MRIAVRILASWCLLIAGPVPEVHAQAGSAELTGVVRDEDAAAVPGAGVTVTHVATSHVRLLVTDSGVA